MHSLTNMKVELEERSLEVPVLLPYREELEEPCRPAALCLRSWWLPSNWRALRRRPDNGGGTMRLSISVGRLLMVSREVSSRSPGRKETLQSLQEIKTQVSL